jgi:hypothetical protein
MSDRPKPRLAGRFLTINSVIRVNQIEVARDKNLGTDERVQHTPAHVARLRDAVARGWPDGRMTWALSWLALNDQTENYRAIRKLVAEYHERYGDDVTFIPGAYFANANNTREQVNRDLHDGLALASQVVGRSYRPASVVAGFLAAENQRFLAEEEGIHVCQGNIWSQYAIDNQDGDGSIIYPYYPSREHFCKPAQGKADFIDCVNLDGWTCDFLAARRAGFEDGFNSRLGAGPIETLGGLGPELGLRQMMGTTAAHFDDGCSRNGFGWVTACWEVCLLDNTKWEESLAIWLAQVKARWPQARFITQGEFGLEWRKHFADNRPLDYRFVQRGTGLGGSDQNQEIRWFMNRDFRLALLRDWTTNGPESVIDFTRYDLPAQEPREQIRNWSLLGRINQKRTRPQDRPVPLAQLSEDDRRLIRRRVPELGA